MTEALAKATRDFFTARMLGLVLWPLLGSLLLWSFLGYFFWHDLVSGLQHLASVPALSNLFGDSVLHVVSEFSVAIALLLILPPLVQASALLITATLAMPLMVEFVAKRDYPQLQRRKGGTVSGSIWNALASTLVYLLLWLVTLPLWLFGIPAIVLPVLQRLAQRPPVPLRRPGRARQPRRVRAAAQPRRRPVLPARLRRLPGSAGAAAEPDRAGVFGPVLHSFRLHRAGPAARRATGLRIAADPLPA